MMRPLRAVRRPSICRAALAAAACLAPLAASAAGYTFTTIAVPGAVSTYQIGLNASGTLLGGYQNTNGFIGGFIYEAGKIKLISVPSAPYTQPASINKEGKIVGTFEYACPTCINHGFIYAGGKYTRYDAPGNDATQETGLSGVNDLGVIVGTTFLNSLLDQTVFTLSKSGTMTAVKTTGASYTLAINNHGAIGGTEASANFGEVAFRYHAGKLDVLPIADTNFVLTGGLNNTGTIVGSYSKSGTHSVGFVTDGKKVADLAMPGMADTYAQGINDAGVIVGTANGAGADDTKQTGFVYSGGTYTPITVPGAFSTTLRSINAAGQVAGQFVTSTGATQAFLATPSP